MQYIVTLTTLCSNFNIYILVTVVDIRFGGKDGEDHLFLRIGEDWRGENGLIIGHVSVYPMYTALFFCCLTHLINS